MGTSIFIESYLRSLKAREFNKYEDITKQDGCEINKRFRDNLHLNNILYKRLSSAGDFDTLDSLWIRFHIAEDVVEPIIESVGYYFDPIENKYIKE